MKLLIPSSGKMFWNDKLERHMVPAQLEERQTQAIVMEKFSK